MLKLPYLVRIGKRYGGIRAVELSDDRRGINLDAAPSKELDHVGRGVVFGQALEFHALGFVPAVDYPWGPVALVAA